MISHARALNLHTLAGRYTPPARLVLFAPVTSEIFLSLTGLNDNYARTQRG